MDSFYANLMTKNIALGGTIDNAISAYTAGSSRSQTLIVEKSNELEPDVINITNDNKKNNQKKDAIDSQEKIFQESENTSNFPSESLRNLTDNNPNNTNQTLSPSSLETKKESSQPKPLVISKDQMISDAKARYLARKRQLDEIQ